MNRIDEDYEDDFEDNLLQKNLIENAGIGGAKTANMVAGNSAMSKDEEIEPEVPSVVIGAAAVEVTQKAVESE